MGITCLFIATKFEDNVQPTIYNMMHFAQPGGDHRLLKKHIQELELKILESLNYDIQYPTSYRFFEIFCNQVKARSTHRVFG